MQSGNIKLVIYWNGSANLSGSIPRYEGGSRKMVFMSEASNFHDL